MSIFKIFKYLLIDQFMLYGGGGKGGSAPSAPDPNVVAAATTKTNQDTAAFNKALNLNNSQGLLGTQQTVQTGTDPNTGAPIYKSYAGANPLVESQFNQLMTQNLPLGNYINQQSLAGLGNLQGQYSGLNGGLQGLQGQYQGLNQSIGGLQGQYQGLNQNLGALQGQYQGLNQGIDQLGGQYSNLQGQLAGINSSIDPDAGKAAQQAGQDAAYKAQTQYLDPQFSQQNESLSASLANQGLAPGSQAYNNAMTNFNNQKQQAYSNAQNQAVMTGSQIGAQSLNNQLNAASSKAGLVGQQGSMLGNQAGLFGLQGNNLSQQAGIYGQQGSNIGSQAGLYGQQGANLGAQAGLYGQQGSNLGAQAGLYGQQVGIGQTGYQNLGQLAGLIPGAGGIGQASSNPADIAGLYNNQYQSQLANYNAQQQSANNTQSGIMGLGSAAIMASMFSDRRLKRSVKRVATWANGLGVYTYRYKWEPKGVRHLGFMADEVRKIAPFAVLRDTSGFDRVNYQLAGSAR